MKLQLLTSFYALSHIVQAHMEVSWPYPMKSKFNVLNLNPDYNLLAPLAADGSEFPCKNYNTQVWPSVTTLTAGNSYNMTLSGTAFHNGGSCQIALSYDNGGSFHVIKSFIGGCPAGLGPQKLPYTVPSFVPAGSAILAWTWINHSGNREFYMNCISVAVINNNANLVTFLGLPAIWVANQLGVNSCATTEGVDPVFPDPGPQVQYGGGLGPNSPKSPSNCEKRGNVQNIALPSSSADPASISAAPSVYPPSVNPSASYSTIYSYASCDSSISGTETITITSTTTSTISSYSAPSSFVTVTVSVSIPGCMTDTSSSYRPSTTSVAPDSSSISINLSSVVPGTSSIAPISSSTALISSSAAPGISSIVSPEVSSLLGNPSASASVRSPPLPSPSTGYPYVDPANFSDYLPCVPGTFLCTTPIEFYTCDQTVDSGYQWQYPRPVAEGMMCLPAVEPNDPGFGQQPGAPLGFHRGDSYVPAGSINNAMSPGGDINNATPGGACSPDGTLGCYNDGNSFTLCNYGHWVNMGSVAAGTKCMDGGIIAAPPV